MTGHENTAAGTTTPRLVRDTRGSTATVFAMLSPLLLLGMAVVTDAVSWYNTRAKLQRAAETSALAAARQLTLANTNSSTVIETAKTYAAAHLASAATMGAAVTATLIENGAAVKVDISRNVEPMLGRFYPESPVIVRATATARVAGSANICAIGLSGSDIGTVALRMNARVSAAGCAIYSNSKSPLGLFAYDGAAATASLICSAGGYGKLGAPQVNPQPTLDCPAIGDPLAGRTDPPIGGCTANNLVVTGGTRSLAPGVYCGGLKVQGGAKVALSPGVYVFKDGPLVVTGASSFTGQYVGLFFKDSGGGFLNTASLWFMKYSTVDLTGPKDGPMAGMLLSESAGNRLVTHLITSDDARNLLGTIYLPKGILTIDGDKPVADRSAYTIIVARNIKLEQGPNLYLNANYGQTDIPVPKGVGPVGRVVRLGT